LPTGEEPPSLYKTEPSQKKKKKWLIGGRKAGMGEKKALLINP